LTLSPFEEARTFVHSLGLKNQKEWRKYCRDEIPSMTKRLGDIPSNPHRTYKDKGWISYGDWLGTGIIAPRLMKFRPFEEARTFVHSLALRSQTEWYKYCSGELHNKQSKPDDIPALPQQTYKNKGWISWGDWLGTGSIASYLKKYRTFKDARAFVRSLQLKSKAEWYRYCKGELKDKGKKPDDIPANPHNTYKNKGWISMGDWLGTGTVAPQLMQYQPFREARAFVHKLHLKNLAGWRKYCKGELSEKKPNNIPANADGVYKDKGWINWNDWLGTDTVAPFLRQYRPFYKARVFVRRLKLKSQSEWKQYCKGNLPQKGKKPNDIPAAPHLTYKDKGWINWGDWLGTGNIASQFMKYQPFRKAREFVRKLKLKSMSEWQKYCSGMLPQKGKKPDDIPNAPHMSYKNKGWINWGDWLGTGMIASQLRKYRPFEKARAFVRKLGLKNGDEWRKYYKGELPGLVKKPNDIPANPDRTYKKKGWVSWPDWLGKTLK
jgi:hypothetical protein